MPPATATVPRPTREVQRPSPADGRPTREELIAAIKRARPVHKLDDYWCLTLQIDVCAPGESRAYAMRYFNRLIRDLRHKHGRFEYICLPEVTERGYVHVNVYSSLHLSQAALREAWSIATQGTSHVVYAARVHPGRLEEYLTKQLAAATTNQRPATTNQRRWSTSQGIRLMAFIPATRTRAGAIQPGLPHAHKLPDAKQAPSEREGGARAAPEAGGAVAESPSGGVPTLSIIQPLTAEQGAMDPGAREREHIAAAAIVAATLPGVGDPATTRAAAIGGLRAALERAQEAGTLPASLRPLLLAKRAAALATPLPCGAPPSGTPEPPGPARQTRHRASQRCPRPVSGAPAPVPRAPDPLPGLSAAPRAVSDAPATRPLTGGPPVPPSAPVLTAEQPVSGAPAVSAQRVSFAAYLTARGLKVRPGPGRVMALATAQREADKRAPPQPDLGVKVRAPCPVCEPPQQEVTTGAEIRTAQAAGRGAARAATQSHAAAQTPSGAVDTARPLTAEQCAIDRAAKRLE